MAPRIPLDRLKHVARSGLEIGKVAGARATRAAAAGVTRAVETADALRERGGRASPTPPEAQPGATSTGAQAPTETKAPPAPSADAPSPQAPSSEAPSPTDVAKVVERKPAAEKATARKAPPRKAAKKQAKKAAPGAKLPPPKQADV